MVPTPKTVKVTPETTIDEVLADADAEPVLLEKNGTVYRLSRETAKDDIWAGYDPEKVRRILEEFAGVWDDLDADRLIADIYEARERGSRHSINR
jgi:hypothetical protein